MPTPCDSERWAFFDVMATSPWPAPWRRLGAPPGMTVGYATELDGIRIPAAYSSTELHATADAVLALVLDSRGTGLAGSLLEWTSEPLDERRQRVRYVVAMPRPFRPRVFHVLQTWGRDGDVHWLHAQDARERSETPPGQVSARLHRADYRLTVRPQGALRVERLLAVNLGLPVPIRVFAHLLGREQIADVRRMKAALLRSREGGARAD